jgi:hypothetical protein
MLDIPLALLNTKQDPSESHGRSLHALMPIGRPTGCGHATKASGKAEARLGKWHDNIELGTSLLNAFVWRQRPPACNCQTYSFYPCYPSADATGAASSGVPTSTSRSAQMQTRRDEQRGLAGFLPHHQQRGSMVCPV